MPRKYSRAAFTLVEMIVVVAIISLMVAIAVPTMSRLGIMGRDPIGAGSRDILSALKTARVYASANRVDTAVVYSVSHRKDNQTGVLVPVIDGYALVRRLKPDEFQQWKDDQDGGRLPGDPLILGSEDENQLPFVPINKGDGVFTPLPEGVAVMPSAFYYEDPDTGTVSFVGMTNSGLLPIRIYKRASDRLALVTPRPSADATPVVMHYPFYFQLPSASPDEPWEGFAFPAHVFKPTGVVESMSPKARFLVRVGPAPDADEKLRFIEDDSGTVIPTDTADISLYAQTGRAQIADIEDTEETST